MTECNTFSLNIKQLLGFKLKKILKEYKEIHKKVIKRCLSALEMKENIKKILYIKNTAAKRN